MNKFKRRTIVQELLFFPRTEPGILWTQTATMKNLFLLLLPLLLSSCGGAATPTSDPAPSQSPSPSDASSVVTVTSEATTSSSESEESKLDFVGASFEDATFAYDGNPHILGEVTRVPSGTSISYEGREEHVDAGTYVAKATLTKEGYNTLVLTATLTITPASFAGVTFPDRTLVHDGLEHALTCKNVPEGATVSYENNVGTDVGVYQAKAVIRSKNYEELTLTATLTITAFDPATHLGTKPVFTNDGYNVTYGLFPQTHVAEEETLARLKKLGRADIAANHYFKLGNFYYAKLTATPFDGGDPRVFADGTPIVSGEEYWFLCEPICWDVLSNDEGECFLFSSLAIDTQQYDHHEKSYDGEGDEYIPPCSYSHSDIRGYLNDAFYKSAFGLDKQSLLLPLVDNSYDSTDGKNVWNYSPDTDDFVFLPSYKELRTYDYGFSTNNDATFTRQKGCTDYARATGATSRDGHTLYWTRSPYSGNRMDVWMGLIDGSLDTGRPYLYHGVCPCVYIAEKIDA